MSSALLQWIALLTMAVDHIGYRLFPRADILRMIGRIAFPLFVFLLAEGFVHTRSRGRYLGRLALFALVSEVPYRIFTHGAYWWAALLGGPWANVFYELLLAFAAIWSVQAAERNRLFLAATALCTVAAAYMGTMYGWYGIVMGICFYLFRDRRPVAVLCLAVLTVLYCIQRGSLFQIYAILAAVPIYLYNGRRGRRLPRYFAYIFYPAHLLAIYGAYCLMA